MNKKRLIFDLDGTLIETDYTYEQEYFNKVLNKEDAKKLLSIIGTLLKEYENTYDTDDINKMSNFLTIKTGINITPKIIEDWLNASFNAKINIIAGVYETLEYLKSKGYSMVILTNWFLKTQISKLERLKIDKYFEHIYSGDIILKPKKEAYLNACGNYLLEECIMIGDSLTNDVMGAINIGLSSIYINTKNESIKNIENAIEINDIKKLQKIL